MVTQSKGQDLALVGVLIAAGIAFLAAHPNAIQYDQGFIRYGIAWGGVPAWDAGITSHWFVWILNQLFRPASEPALDSVIRSASLTLYLASTAVLARTVFGDLRSRVAVGLLIFTSGYPFLWLSSEIITGSFMALTLAALVSWSRTPSRGRGILGGLAAAALAFTKPDLPLVALTLCAAALFLRRKDLRDPRGRVRALELGAAFFGTCAVFATPGLLAHGSAFFANRGYSFFQPNSASSFCQHYSALVAPHQVTPAPEPWTGWEAYMTAVFPGARNIGDVIRMHFSKYVDFLFLSASRSTKNLGKVFWALFFLVAAARATRGFRPPNHALAANKSSLANESNTLLLFAVTIIGIIPMQLLAYVHIRYLARYYPLAAIAALLVVSRLPRGRWIGIVGAAILLQSLKLLASYQQAQALGVAFWFPD